MNDDILYDEYVEEIHQIRARLYEESKSLTCEQRREKTHAASAWVRQRIAELRVSNAKKKNAAAHEMVVR
ncbi:MAG: hypothetical protein ACRC46_12815 [Thermoguttaceae bacterium]